MTPNNLQATRKSRRQAGQPPSPIPQTQQQNPNPDNEYNAFLRQTMQPPPYASIDPRAASLPPSPILASTASSSQDPYARSERFEHARLPHIPQQFTPTYVQDTVSIQSSVTNPPSLAQSTHHSNNLQHQVAQLLQSNTFLQQQHRTMAQQMHQSQQQVNQMLQTMNSLQEENRLLMHQILQKDKVQTQSYPTSINTNKTQHNKNDSNMEPNTTTIQPIQEPEPPVLTSTQEYQNQSTHDSPMLSKLIQMMDKQTKYYETKADSTTTLRIPKFKGKSRLEFRTWYDQVLSLLQAPPWNALYNAEVDDIIEESPSPSQLSQKLYAALRVSMEGDAQTIMMGKKHLRGKGLQFLQTLRRTYYDKLTKTEIAQLEDEYSKLSRLPEERIDTYAARCLQIQRDLNDNDISISDARLKNKFILGLGPLFTTIQTNIDNLPKQWQSNNLDEIIHAANSYMQNVLQIREMNKQYREQHKPTPNTTPNPNVRKQPNLPNQNANQNQNQNLNQNQNQFKTEEDKARQDLIRKSITEGTYYPGKFLHMVRPNCCIWHNTNSHLSPQCSVIQNMLQQYPRDNQYRPSPRPNNNPNRNVPPANNPNPQAPIPRNPRQIPTNQANQPTQNETPQQPQPIARLTQTQEPIENVDLGDLHAAIAELGSDNHSNDTVSPYLDVVTPDIKPDTKTANCNNVYTTAEPNKSTFILDSAAYPHMCTNRKLFTTFTEQSSFKEVTLADGNSTIKVQGTGTIKCKIGNNEATIEDVLYVPDLQNSLFSITQHVEKQGHFVLMENNKATIAFPSFTHTIPIVEKEVKMEVQCAKQQPNPAQPNAIKYMELSPSATTPDKATPLSAGFDLFASTKAIINPKSRKLIKTDIAIEIPKGHYGRVAPRSSLSTKFELDIGAGVIDADYRGEIKILLINNGNSPYEVKPGDKIAQVIIEKISTMELTKVYKMSNTQRGNKGFGSSDSKTKVEDQPHKIWHQNFTNPRKVSLKLPWNNGLSKGTLHKQGNTFVFEENNIKITLPMQHIKNILKNNQLLIGHHHLTTPPALPNSNPSQTIVPDVRIEDKPIVGAPKTTTLTIDQMKKAFGFRNIESIIKEIRETSTNLHISTLEKEQVIDIGEAATIDRHKRNTKPLTLPTKLGDIVHMDVLYGSNTAIGGIKYALFLVDKATRNKFVYPIKNLKEDILPAIKQFCMDIGQTPRLMRTDFDHKLMGQNIRTYLTENKCKLESAPPDLQYQNGVCERNWRSLLRMSRSWLASSLLPSTFWWFALKRATEVANYVPLKINGKLTTPHQQAYGKKVDMRNLFPMFAVSYPSYKSQHSFNTQSVRAILVGRSSKTNALLFYHPKSKNLITSSRYIIDETLPAGPTFAYEYDGGTYINKYTTHNSNYKAPSFPPESKVYITTPNKSILQAEVIAVPIQGDIYTTQYPDGSIHQHQEKELHTNDPTITPETSNQTQHLPTWIKHNAKCTMFDPIQHKPKHGTLIHDNKMWYFRPGTKTTNIPTPLPNLEQTIHQLIQTFEISKGHKPFKEILQAKRLHNAARAIARHVSAKTLTSRDAPTLKNHNKLNKQDKTIWDAAYAEEYYGLQNLPAWITIPESEYCKMKHIYKTPLPTMAISTIKYNETGEPKRAKYRIVVLGNLDPNTWTKESCYAPVMSLMELRLLTAIAVSKNCALKNGDVKQAFCQAVLPPTEKYVLQPPPGCPLTPPNTLWLLQRTLYGLKRSPRHWYDKMTKMLEKVGLMKCPNSPCLFKGTVIPNAKPLYLGLYVDDFVYFSEDPKVERKFEELLGKQTNVDFMGQVSHFLGIRYQWRKTENRTQVHLSQESFADQLINHAKMDNIATKTALTPYRSGCPVDALPKTKLLPQQRHKLETELRSYVGSLLWLSQATRPDLSTVTNILAKYQNQPTQQVIDAAKYVIRYIKGTKNKGIVFDSESPHQLISHTHFPVHTNKLIATADANWGPQDQSIPAPKATLQELDLFKTRSISGHLITFKGPIQWSSKRQKITARSSGEAEIYATDECVKDLMHMRNLITDLELHEEILDEKTKLFNDNMMACVQWSKNTTTKGLRYLQIRENAIRENKHWLDILHVEGKKNPADIFSKEEKSPQHFLTIRNTIIQDPFQQKAAEEIVNSK